jgi:hypothetical protein
VLENHATRKHRSRDIALDLNFHLSAQCGLVRKRMPPAACAPFLHYRVSIRATVALLTVHH